jgi:hypothetical protein
MPMSSYLGFQVSGMPEAEISHLTESRKQIGVRIPDAYPFSI